MKNKSIVTNQLPIVTTPKEFVDPQPVWRVGDFNELIDNHGYEAYIDRALRCPCNEKSGGQALSTCQNCSGRGWVFVDRKLTRVVSQGMNNAKRFKDFSEINQGTAKITTRGIDKLGFMDRIILIELEAYYSEVLRPILFGGEIISYPIYEPIEITNIYLFVSDDKPLLPLTNKQYTIKGNRISFDLGIQDLIESRDMAVKDLPISITVRYSYAPVYHVLDANRELMKVRERNESLSDERLTAMPINVTCRKAHYMFDAQKFGVEIFDNTIYE